MIKDALHRLETLVEHKLKHLGLFTGMVMTCFLGPLLLALDLWVIRAQNAAAFHQLVGLSNVFLSIIIGILLTSFSVIFVVMQLASSQFSPRVLRYFLYNDFKVQRFIGLFLGAIGLILLPQVAMAFYEGFNFLLSVSVALLVCFWCLILSFPRMIAYLSDNMNVATITNRIKNDVVSEIHILYKEDWKPGDRMLYKRSQRDKQKYSLNIRSPFPSGYLDRVDYAQLSQEYHDFLAQYPAFPKSKVYQKPIIGEFVLAQTSNLIAVEFDEALNAEEERQARQFFTRMAESSFSVNKYRSYTQDINFGVRKLVDIAIKAISPAVNDPTTCLNCIDYLGEIVRVLCDKKFPSTQAQALKTAHIIINEFDFDELVDFCFGQIHHWGKMDPVVVRRLLQTIRQLLPFAENPYHLMTLIREVEEMELSKVYPLTDVEGRSATFTREQVRGVRREMERFEQWALEQVRRLDAAGILDIYACKQGENPEESIVRKEEAAAIAYLRNRLETV